MTFRAICHLIPDYLTCLIFCCPSDVYNALATLTFILISSSKSQLLLFLCLECSATTLTGLAVSHHSVLYAQNVLLPPSQDWLFLIIQPWFRCSFHRGVSSNCPRWSSPSPHPVHISHNLSYFSVHILNKNCCQQEKN